MVTFQSVPSFVNELKDERAVENETVVFECQFSGNPTPVIIWYHDDKIVRNSSNIQVKITDTKTTLTIKRVTKEDEGVYVCKANSNLGEAKNKSKLYVKKHRDETFTATEDEVEVQEVQEVKKIKKTKKKAMKKKQKKESESYNETETKETLRITTSKMVEEKSSLPEHEPLSTSETFSDETVKEVRGSEFVRPKLIEEPALFTALKVKEPSVVNEVEQVLDQVELAEFGPAEWPLRELATIDILTRHGISTEQVIEEYTSGQFPALRTAPAQSAMVHLIEREGYTSLVADVFTKESTIPETVNEVFKAFMTMIELKHSTLEEIITYLMPEDFQTSTWDFEHASQITTDDTITDTAEISEPVNILVNEVKKKTRSTKESTKITKETLSIDDGQVQNMLDDSNIKITEITDNSNIIIDVSEDKPIKTEKVIKQKNKTDYITTREDKEKEEVITKETNMVKKIKVKRSNPDEEIIPEEITYEFDVEKYPVISPTILKTSKTLNETIAQQEAVELSTDYNNLPEKAHIRIITRSAAESIVTKDEEKEEMRKETLEIKKHKANSVFECNVSFSTDNPDTQSPLEEIVKPFEFIPCMAIKDFIPKESVKIIEIYPNQSLGKGPEYKPQNKEANVTVISHLQKVVTESIASTKEGEIVPEFIPQKKKATQEYIELESINVVEVNEAHTESQLQDVFKPTLVKPSVEYPLNEQLVISESHYEIQPEKYYPEIIVPTEIAKQLIVPSNNAITAFQIESAEKEAKYNRMKPPTAYKADISVIPKKYIEVSESNIQEKETKLEKEKIPEKSFAISDIIVQSSIIVNSVDQEENEEKFSSHLPQPHTAKLTINNPNKVCTSSIIEMNEAESDLKVPLVPEMKQIESSVFGLEVLDVTEIIPNETESNFTSQSALELLPHTSFTENNSYIVTETTPDEYSTDLLKQLNYKTYEAEPKFEELEAKQISQIDVHENDSPLNEISKPTPVKLETKFAPIQSITVEQTIAAEQEQCLLLKVQPKLHNTVSVPSHSLQAVVIEEITLENCVTNLENTFDDDNRNTSKTAHINFVDDQCIIVKEVSAYESESNLSLDCQPENVCAVPEFSGHDVAETIEIISNDAVEKLNIKKYKNDKAVLKHVPYEALISEVTSTNELEDVLHNKEKKQPKTLNVTIDEVISVNIIEPPVYEKEKISIEQKEFKTKNAITEFVPIEAVNRSEIVTGDYTLDLIQPEVSKLHAYHQPSTFESVILYETNISEKEKIMINHKLPSPCLANTSLIVDEAIEVTEITSDNRPEDIFDSIVPREEKAETNIIPFKSLEAQDIMTCENVEAVTDKSPITGVAHISQKPFHSIETTLIISTDSENKLSEFVMPNLKKAETNFSELDIPISVVEILTQDKELDFKANEIPSHTLDKQEIILDECRETLETMVCNSTCDFDEFTPQPVYALTSKSTQIAIELLETAPLEKEGGLVDDKIVSKKRADFTYEEVKSIQITEQVKLDTKQNLIIESIPTEQKSNIIITGQDVAETFETIIESPIEELKIEFPKEKSAKTIGAIEVHGVEISEIITQETESAFDDNKRHKKKTVNVLVEDNSPCYMVTEIFPNEKETQLKDKSQPNYCHAEQDILSHEGLQVNETNVSICEKVLDDFEYSTKLGSQIIEPLKCIEISEVNVQEPECNLFKLVRPKMEIAVHGLNENVGLIINTTVINDKENELKIDKLNTKNATKVSNLIDYKVPQKSEKNTLECVKPLKVTKETVQQAISEHILLEGIHTTEVDLQDTEIPFDQSTKSTEKSASLEYETEQTLDVTEVCVGESESDLIPTSLPRSHIAVSDMSEAQQVASSFEMISQNSTNNLTVKALPSITSIVPQLTEIHSIEVTETLYQESEIPFKAVENVLKTGSITIQLDQNIEVTETITNESEKTLNSVEVNKDSVANIVFDENQTVMIEEIETSDDIAPLTEIACKPLSAKKQFEPLLGILVTEVMSEESEITHEKPIPPLLKHVTQIIPEHQSLNVTSTISVDTESILKKPKQEIQQSAQSSSVYSPMKVAQFEEKIIQMGLNDLKTTTPSEIYLKPFQIPFDSINQLEISPLEKEGELEVTINQKNEVANINMDTINIFDTTEIIPCEKESVYIPLTKPITRQALIDITDSQPVSRVSEIKTEDSTSELKIPKVVTCTVIPSQEVVHGVVIVDNISHDREEIFEKEYKPPLTTAKINVENEKETKTVTEIITQEMEGQVKNLDMPSTKIAQVEITSGKEIAEIIETISNTALGSLKDFVTKSSTAIPVQDTFKSIQSTITITEDKENSFSSNLIYEKSKVDINIEESKSVNITEVIVEDKEEKYISPELPTLMTAGESILTNEAAENTIILTNEHLRTLEKLKTKEESANIVLDTFTNIYQTETTVQESEKNFEPVEQILNKAELTMIPNNSLIITEVITDDKDEKLHIKNGQKSQKVTTSLSKLHKAPQVSEIISSITTSDVFIPGIDNNHALISQSELYDTVISTEINALEKEKLFTQKIKFDKFNAEIKFKEDKSLNVFETVSNDKELPLAINKPLEKQASLTQSSFDVFTISENTINESEMNLESTIVPEEQMVNILFESNVNVQVTEANIIDSESDLITPIQNAETATISKLITQPVANVTEIITSVNVQELPILNQPEYRTATPLQVQSTYKSILQTEIDISESEGILDKPKCINEKASIKTETFDNIIITEPEVSEKEGLLEGLKKTDLSQAQLLLEETKSSIIISNVASEDKETEFTIGPQRKSSVAKITSENLQAITNSEQNVSEKEGTLLMKIPRDETANVIFEDVQSEIVVSTVLPEYKEENLKIKNTTYSTAKLLTENFESLIQNEQIVNEKEQIIRLEQNPAITNASVSIEKAKTGVVVSEVLTHDKENDFHESQVRRTSKASISTEELRPLITTETRHLSNVDELKIQKIVPDDVAKIKLDEFRHLTVHELITNETESKMIQIKPIKFNISPTILEIIPLESNQVETETQPIISKEPYMMSELYAEKLEPQKNDSIKNNEDKILESTIKLKQDAIDDNRASITEIPMDTEKLFNDIPKEESTDQLAESPVNDLIYKPKLDIIDDASKPLPLDDDKKKSSNEVDIREAFSTLKPRNKNSTSEEDEIVSITFVPKQTKQKEVIEQEFSIKAHTYEEEEISMTGNVKLHRKSILEEPIKQLSINENEDVHLHHTDEGMTPNNQNILTELENSEIPCEVLENPGDENAEKILNDRTTIEMPEENKEQLKIVNVKPERTRTPLIKDNYTADEITIEKLESIVNEEEQPLEEVEVKLKSKRKPSLKKETKETSLEQTSVLLKRPKKKEETPQEQKTSGDVITIKPIIEKPEDVQEVTETVDIITKPIRKHSLKKGDASDEITIEKFEPVVNEEEQPLEEVEVKLKSKRKPSLKKETKEKSPEQTSVLLKRPKKKEEIPQEQETSEDVITIKPIIEKPEDVQEVTETVDIIAKPIRKHSFEKGDASDEITIEKFEPVVNEEEQPLEEVEVKLKSKRKPSLKKERKEKSPEQTSVLLKRPKKKEETPQEQETSEDVITIKPIIEKSEDVQEVTETVDIIAKPVRKPSLEKGDASDEITIEKFETVLNEEEQPLEEVEVKLKSKRKPSLKKETKEKSPEQTSVLLKRPKKKEETPQEQKTSEDVITIKPIIEKSEDVQEVTETVDIIAKPVRKHSLKKGDASDEITIEKFEPVVNEEEQPLEEVEVKLKSKRKPSLKKETKEKSPEQTSVLLKRPKKKEETPQEQETSEDVITIKPIIEKSEDVQEVTETVDIIAKPVRKHSLKKGDASDEITIEKFEPVVNEEEQPLEEVEVKLKSKRKPSLKKERKEKSPEQTSVLLKRPKKKEETPQEQETSEDVITIKPIIEKSEDVQEVTETVDIIAKPVRKPSLEKGDASDEITIEKFETVLNEEEQPLEEVEVKLKSKRKPSLKKETKEKSPEQTSVLLKRPKKKEETPQEQKTSEDVITIKPIIEKSEDVQEVTETVDIIAKPVRKHSLKKGDASDEITIEKFEPVVNEEEQPLEEVEVKLKSKRKPSLKKETKEKSPEQTSVLLKRPKKKEETPQEQETSEDVITIKPIIEKSEDVQEVTETVDIIAKPVRKHSLKKGDASDEITIEKFEPVVNEEEQPLEEVEVKLKSKRKPSLKKERKEKSPEQTSVLLKRPKKKEETPQEQETSEDVITIKPIIEKSEDVQEVTETVDIIAKPVRKPSLEKGDASDEITIEKFETVLNEEEQPLEEVEVKLKSKRKPSLKKETKEKSPEQTSVLLKRPKKKEETPQEQETSEDVITIKPIIEKSEDVQEVTETVDIIAKPVRKHSLKKGDASDEITIEKFEPVVNEEEQPLEEVEVKLKSKRKPSLKKETKEKSPEQTSVLLKRPKKKEEIPQEQETSEDVITIKPIIEKPEDVQEVTETVDIIAKPIRKHSFEKGDASDEITIEKFEPVVNEEEQPLEEVEVKLKSKRKPSLKKETKETSPEQTSVLLKRPKKKEETPQEQKTSEDVITIKPIIEKPEDVQEVTETVDITAKPIRKHSLEKGDASDEITIEKFEPVVNEEEQPLEEVDVKLKSKRKPSLKKETKEKSPEQTSVLLNRPKKKEEIVQTLNDHEEVFTFKNTIKKPEVIQDISETVDVKIEQKKKPSIVKEEASDNITIEQTETIINEKDQPSKDVDVKLKLKQKTSLIKETREKSPDESSVIFKLPMKKVEILNEIEKVFSVKQTPEKLTPLNEDISESVEFQMKPKRNTPFYNVDEGTEELFQIELKPKKKLQDIIIYEEESLDFKVKRKPSLQSFSQDGAELKIVQEKDIFVKDNYTLHEDSHDGEIMFAIRSYIAENEDALDLVEGEKVYVIESNNQEWWFVKKHLTEEKGWVPSIYLRDETSYMRYVQKKLHEKIDKLPIFQRHASIEKPSAPRFVEKLQPKHVPDGGTVQFECHVEGNPRPQITWFRQTAIIKPSQDFQIFYDEDNVATLIIREVFPEDAGTFTCVAKNVAGFASSTTELTVEAPLSDHGSDVTGLSRKSMSRESSLADILEGIPPTFSRKPKATCASEHSDVTIECRLVAVPEPDIFWHYNGREISVTDSIKVNTYSDMHFYVSSIKINDVLKTQEGVYSVIARNREGEAKMDLVLKVKTGLPEKPQILEPLYDITINEGETAVLSTQISGEPQPMVEWLKNSKKITDIKTFVTKDGVHSLTIDNPTPRDSAKYTVIASNPLGNAQTTCFLAVEELPGPQAPLFIERFQEQTVKEKGTITLIAKVTGNPVPIVSWFRNNKPLLASSKKKEVFDGENIVLEIVNADSEEDAGDYKCVASNTFGTATHGARVSVDVPQVKFVRSLTDVEVDEKQSIYLECETSHTVSTKWQLNGKDLSGMDHRELHQEGRLHRLIIKKSSILDSGKYTCLVKDQFTSSTVIVHDVKAEFIKKLEDVEVKENDCAILEVEVSSETVNVTWHKNGEMLTDGMKNKIFFEKEGQTRKLIIRSVSVHDDGEYTCSLGEQECTAEINVIELAPQIIKKLKDQKVATGEQVLFEIELTKGDALVKWTKDGKELQLNNNVRLTIDGKRQKLEIVKATKTDTGVYGCQVHEQTCTAKLTVEEPRASFIKKLPDITLAVQGSNIKLTVELSKPDIPVKWLRSGKMIKESEKYEIISEGAVHTLVIKKPTTDDEAEYICTAVNVKTSTKLKVEVNEEPPKINNLPKEYRLKNGEDLNVDVTFTSTSLPTVEWFINGNILIKSNRVSYSINESSASLTITKVEEVDTGVLTLKLKNIYGETTADMNIIVIKVPGEPGIPDIIEVTDTSVTLHWKPPQFDGNSPIEGYVVEYHDKDEFMVWHKVKVTDTTHEVTNLVTGHEIMFKVAAINCAGIGPTSHNTKYIKMASPGSFTPPVIQEPLSDLSIGMGKLAVLQCVITGKPTPDIKWFKNKIVYKTKTTSFENHVAKLTITECSESTIGTYTCQATNGAGTAQTSCKLSVQDVPKIEVHESEISQMIRVRNQWKVKATYKGYPRPTISWLKNNQPLSVADKHISVYDDDDEWSSTIAIYSAERPDTGVYTVTASNDAGTATCNLNLKVIDKPSAPQGPMRIKEINSDSVTIEWNKPSDDGGLEISSYQVERCNVGKMVWSKVADVDHDVSAYSVQKLHEDAEYMFRVCAQNAVGASDFLDSEPVTVKCRYHKPSAPQGPLQITGVTDTSSTIAWLPPFDNGGIAIEDYCVEIKEVDKKAWRKIGSTKDLHIKLLDLKKGSSYDVRITARNHVGYGKPYQSDEPIVAGKRINFRNGISDETLYVLMGIFPTRPRVSASPSPPTELTVSDITSKSVTLHWGLPESNGGSDITGYVIEKQLNTTNKWFKVATLEPTVMKYCVENLKEKSEYFFKIYAENCIGLSQPVETKLVSLLTHATVPSPPTAPLEVRNLSSNAVIVEWGVPETDGGAPLLGYNIAIRDEKKTMWMEVGRVEADVQKFNIKDLQENHRYQIRILAKNEVGISEPLETEEPYTVQKPTDYYESDVEESVMESKPSLTQTSETTTSWLRENNMDADISSYSNAALLKRSEYFFRIWYYARTLFK